MSRKETSQLPRWDVIMSPVTGTWFVRLRTDTGKTLMISNAQYLTRDAARRGARAAQRAARMATEDIHDGIHA